MKPSSTTTTSRPPHFLFPDPEFAETLHRYDTATEGEERLALAELARQQISVPDGGPELRAWLRWLLQRVQNKKTKRAYTQADIGREAGDASGATVSRVFMAELPGGDLSDRVRKVTADVLDLRVGIIWKPTAVCAECGSPLHADGPDTRGDHGRAAVRRPSSAHVSRTAGGQKRARQNRRRSRSTERG